MDPQSPAFPSAALNPTLLARGHNSISTEESPTMARHVHLARESASHIRHQSVPVLSSPQAHPSRGLAKLTLVERLSKESIPSPGTDDTYSPRAVSPSRFDEELPRPTHTPRKQRMSLTIPPTKSATANTGPSRENSPLRSSPVGKHFSTGSLAEISLSPSYPTYERSMTSPRASSLDEVALDDANATFLTLIAFQERRVVELREELARAESELDLLKQQWTRQQLKLTRSSGQEQSHLNSLPKLDHQIMNSATPVTLRADQDEDTRSPQILVAGKRLAEGVRDGFFTIMEDLKAVTGNEGVLSASRQTGRSPTRVVKRERIGMEIAAERVEPTMWYSGRASPPKRAVRRESDTSDSAHETTSNNTNSTRASSISSTTSNIKSPSFNPTTPSAVQKSLDRPISPWAWSMATRILNQSQRHATSLFETVERHLDALAAGPETPLHPHPTRGTVSDHSMTDPVQF